MVERGSPCLHLIDESKLPCSLPRDRGNDASIKSTCTRRRGLAELMTSSALQDYRRAVYAVTSSVTATSLNSGFVQTIWPTPFCMLRRGHSVGNARRR